MTSYLTVALYRCSAFHEVHTLEDSIFAETSLKVKHRPLYIPFLFFFDFLCFTFFFDGFIIKEQTELLGTFGGNVIFPYQIAGADINTPYQKVGVNDLPPSPN